jgi:CO dehydrogenase/acetyl-CoA synthase delta subunit
MEAKDVPLLAKLADNVLLSGGARGADYEWGKNALKYGHQVVHWSFDGHNSSDPANSYILTDQELKEADRYVT